jgi:hypothetical protein
MDEIFDALTSVHRRRLLVALLDHNPQQDNVDEVSIPEDIHEGETVLEALQVDYHHNHLPKLEQAGFILWDRGSHQIMKGERFDEIRPVLKLMHDHSDELPDDWL